jgi:membrane-associated progesterone receptor component
MSLVHTDLMENVISTNQIAILSVIAVATAISYCWLFKPKEATKVRTNAMESTAEVKSEMTCSELKPFDGSDDALPILIGISGKVYDVTKGKDYYGPTGGYRVMAGKDASRLLAKNLLDESKDNGLELTEAELVQLSQWRDFFANKYAVVATLKSD